jgi:DNA-binding LacI/PurR family transcriptional regulator
MPGHLSDTVAAFETGLSIASMSTSERPDVVVCYNDVTAIGVYHGLKRGGLRVPQDIGVTGYDGISEGQCLDLPLTTAAIPVDLACGSAIEMLVHRIERGSNGQPNKMLLPIRLVEGATT